MILLQVLQLKIKIVDVRQKTKKSLMQKLKIPTNHRVFKGGPWKMS
tara:strand:+ start:348 stop:485 length:138 start_codon:yes stop_codon:yes gene_type:complete